MKPLCWVLTLAAAYLAQATTNSTECSHAAEPPASFPMPAPVRWGMIFMLVSMSALFSGLTLGLCGLDKLSLQIVVESGSPKEQKWANKILPLRQDGNLLLCTFLLGNVAVNSAVSILMADVAGGTLGFLVSTCTIVLFGEILPQAVCSRHPLPIGAASAPIVRVMIFFLYPIAKPIAVALDRVLGMEMAAKFSKQELVKLIDIQKTTHNVLTATESRILQGALNFKEKKVEQIMTKIDRVEMLEIDERLDFDVLFRIFKSGHSRIPVFEGDRFNIVGLVFVKDCILISPEDEIPVRTFMECHGRVLHTVFNDSGLDIMLNMFSQWRQQLAVVVEVDQATQGDPTPRVVGIVTLEDVIEELIAQELIDETDKYVSNESRELVAPNHYGHALLKMFDTRIHPASSALTAEEGHAILCFLESAFPDLFGQTIMPTISLAELVAVSAVVTHTMTPENDKIIIRGAPIDHAVLLLQGKAEILHGAEMFSSRVGSFSLIASGALTADGDLSFIPDFSVLPAGPIRFLCIYRAQYQRLRFSLSPRQLSSHMANPACAGTSPTHSPHSTPAPTPPTLISTNNPNYSPSLLPSLSPSSRSHQSFTDVKLGRSHVSSSQHRTHYESHVRNRQDIANMSLLTKHNSRSSLDAENSQL